MAPAERARRGLTPPSRPGQGETPVSSQSPGPIASALDTPAVVDRAGSAPRGTTAGDDDGRYELEGVHARGGIGRVVVAHDRRLNRTVAIKELLERTPSAEARFVREALIAARLQHPGVVPIHEAGRWPSGEPYYAMKLVSGRTLKELIADRAELDERLALLPKVLAVAETIAYAHSENVLHRDIKPANVVVGDFGETVVVDWGLAKDLSGDVEEPIVAEGEDATGAAGDATRAGNVMGTPSYMAPEQARGDDVDARADVFALGALLYEVLCGRPPYLGDDADEILAKALDGKPQPIDERQPDAPPDLCAIVRKAMAADPADRYPSAAPLAEDIRRFQTGQLVTARHYSTRTLMRRWIGRHRAGVAVVSAAVLVAIAMGAIGFGRVVEERNEARQQRAMAERAQAHAEDRSHELVFLQAQSRLARDPTAALAWLKNYPLDGRRAERLPAMIDEAIAMGVSSHVLPHASWVMMVDFVDRDRVVTADMRGVLRIFDVHSGMSHEVADVGGKVWRAVLAPDRRTVAIGHFSGAIELVDLVTGEISQLVEETHDKTVDWVGFSGDGRRLASWSLDRELVVWNISSGERVFRREGDVTAADLSSDGRHVYLTTSDGGLSRIDLETGTASTIATMDGYAIRLIVDRAGKTALAHGHRGTIQLIDLASGVVRTVGEQPAMPGWAEFSPSGRLAATAGTDATVRLIDVASGEQTVLRGHEDSIYQARFSADEELLVSASDDGTARVWHLESGNVRVLRGHQDDVLSVALRVDGGMLATASLDGSLRLWPFDFGDGRLLHGPGGERQMVRFEEDGAELVVAGDGGVIRRWDLDSGEHRDIHLPWDRSVEKGYNYLQLFGTYAVSVTGGRALAVHDLDTGAVTALSGYRDAKPIALSGSKDGHVIAAVYGRGQVRVWQLARPAEPLVIDRTTELQGGALSPDGNTLVVAVDRELELIDLQSTRASAKPPGEPTPVIRSVDLAAAGFEVVGQMRFHFSPDGGKVAIVGKDNSGLIWNTVTGETIAVEVELLGMVSTAFSPDGRYLASAMSDRTVRLFDTETGEMRVFEGHRDLVMRVEFSPDGKLLASSSYDKTVRLWDVKTGETVRVLRGHNSSVDGLGFSADGTQLAAAGRDGTVRLWQLAQLPSHEVSAVAERLRKATSAVVAQDQDIVATPQSR